MTLTLKEKMAASASQTVRLVEFQFEKRGIHVVWKQSQENSQQMSNEGPFWYGFLLSNTTDYCIICSS